VYTGDSKHIYLHVKNRRKEVCTMMSAPDHPRAAWCADAVDTEPLKVLFAVDC